MRAFQVDLRGIVDLLSSHLYSTPEVYVRELLQNSVDALTARGDLSSAVVIEALGGDRPVVTFEDDGIGLTLTEVHELLSTIGASSKRDELLGPRPDFLGRFGIGLLSCFLVADEIVVISRSVRGAPGVRWRGRGDGSYDVEELPEGSGRNQPGTTVFLTARAGAEDLLTPARVLSLVERYGRLLGRPLIVRTPTGDTTVAGGPLPWHRPDADLMEIGQELLSEPFLDAIPLDLPAAGLSGVAYVLPHSPSPHAGQRSFVTLKRMLLAEEVDGLLPAWAFFVRAVVDADALQPVASREGIYEDAALEAVREAIGQTLRTWLLDLAVREPARLQRIVRVHSLSLKALAVHDDELLGVFAPWLPFETSLGRMTLLELVERSPVVRYTDSTETFAQLAQVAAAQRTVLVNAGYTYDAELLERIAAVLPGTGAQRVDSTDVLGDLTEVNGQDRVAADLLARAAAPVLAAFGCEVQVREFVPASLPVLYTVGEAARFARGTDASAEVSDGFWGPLLEAVQEDYGVAAPVLCLNYKHDVVRRLAVLAADPATAAERLPGALEVLYVQALLLGRHPLGRREHLLLGRALSRLVEVSVTGGPA